MSALAFDENLTALSQKVFVFNALTGFLGLLSFIGEAKKDYIELVSLTLRRSKIVLSCF